jgi:L-alanine-DL-glutamate epimerase-like enolase superfamily enzyme
MLLVRVLTDAGIEGWGEAFGHAVAPATKTVLDTMIAPLFVGRDPSDITGLLHEAERKLHIFGRNGPVIYALSGMDIALWDIAGKAAGLPLYRLLGGDACSDVSVYSSLLRCSGPDAVAASCARAVVNGYAHIKLHENTLPCIQAARGAVGADIAIMVDCNCPWGADEAVAMAASLKPLDLYWLEEPVWPPEDFVGLARVRAAGAVTAAGENLSGLHAFNGLFEAGAVDIVQPSVSKMGGITAMRAIIDLADRFEVRVVPHCGYLGPGYFATLHVVASLRGERLLERLDLDLEESPFGRWADVHGGRAGVPQGPGLGCDPDMAVVNRYRMH